MTDRRWAEEWERYGRANPFFGVCNEPQFRGERLDADASREFWASGEAHVDAVAAMVEQVAGKPFAPRRALDFGCGVGRLMAPIGRRAESVVGVDISPAMLDLARARCAEVDVRDASFVLSDATLSRVEGRFDFVHSFIVFQHVPPRLGYGLLDAILARLEPGGAAALHFTYARRAPLLRKLVHRLRRGSRLVNMAVNVIQGAPLRFPMMPMYEYDRARLLATIHGIGAREILQHETDHGGHLGVLLVFQRPA